MMSSIVFFVENFREMRILSLTVPYRSEATYPLFHSHRIPWQVVIEHHVAELKIQSLTTNF